jgi:hypothetical protein
MRSPCLLLFLLAICVVSIRADGPFTKDRKGVVATTTATTPSASASPTPSSVTSTSAASTTSGTASSTSASATSTSSATSSAFQSKGGEIAAAVILVGFIVVGTAFITIWQVRRMLARRGDTAAVRAYAKHGRNPPMDMDVVDTNVVTIMDQRTPSHRGSPQSNFNQTNNDLERQPTGAFAALSRYPTTGAPASSITVSPANSFRHSRSPSPYSDASMRPSSQNTLRRLFSFEGVPRPTNPDPLAERVDGRSALSSNPASTLLSSSPGHV